MSEQLELPKKQHPVKSTNKKSQEKGVNFEGEISASLKHFGCWRHKFLTGLSGTPFDHIAITPMGIALAIECKVVSKSRTLDNVRLQNKQTKEWKQPKELDRFLQYGISYLMVNYKVDNINECWIVPWARVRKKFWDDIENRRKSGKYGSIDIVLNGQLVNRVKLENGSYGWDLSTGFKYIGKEVITCK